MKSKIIAPAKKILFKKQHIKEMMSELYRELSPHSKILKSLLQNNQNNPNLHSDGSNLPQIKRRNMTPPLKKHNPSIVFESDNVYSIHKDFTIEGHDIDSLYMKNFEKSKKKEQEIKKLDEVLFETLEKQKLNPPTFAQRLRKEMRTFKHKSLDFALKAAQENNTFRPTEAKKTKKNIRSTNVFSSTLELSIRKRLDQKKTSSFFSKKPEETNEFLNMYREIQKQQNESVIEHRLMQEDNSLLLFEANGNRNMESIESEQKNEHSNSIRKDPNYRKRLENIEKRKAFEKMLQSAKGRLVEKMKGLTEEKVKKARTFHQSMTFLEKLKQKYEFLGQKVKKPEEDIAVLLENMKKKAERREGNEKKQVKNRTNRIFSMTFNEKVRKILTVSQLDPRKSQNMKRNCDDLLNVANKKKENHAFADTYKDFQSMYQQERKSKGLLREMRTGFLEIERRLRGYKNQLNEVPESLNIMDFKD